jgi:hypothetical protein
MKFLRWIEDGFRWLFHAGVFRFIVTILVAFVATSAFVQGTARDQCQDGKPFLRSYTSQLTLEIKALTALLPITRERHAHALREAQIANDKGLIRGLTPAIHKSCAERYPIFPFIH